MSGIDRQKTTPAVVPFWLWKKQNPQPTRAEQTRRLLDVIDAIQRSERAGTEPNPLWYEETDYVTDRTVIA